MSHIDISALLLVGWGLISFYDLRKILKLNFILINYVIIYITYDLWLLFALVVSETWNTIILKSSLWKFNVRYKYFSFIFKCVLSIKALFISLINVGHAFLISCSFFRFVVISRPKCPNAFAHSTPLLVFTAELFVCFVASEDRKCSPYLGNVPLKFANFSLFCAWGG